MSSHARRMSSGEARLRYFDVGGKTGCPRTTAATSPTTPTTSCHCARISRPVQSTGCRRTSSATAPAASGTSGSPPARGRRPRDPVRDSSRRRARPAGQSGARLDLEREPGSHRADLRQRCAERASARRRHPLRLAGACRREPQRPRDEEDPGCARRRHRVLRRDAVGASGREAERRRGARARDRGGAPARADARCLLGPLRPRRRSEGAGGGGPAARVDFSTPTGSRRATTRARSSASGPSPTQAEIDASVAATIYSLWRGRRWRRWWTGR